MILVCDEFSVYDLNEAYAIFNNIIYNFLLIFAVLPNTIDRSDHLNISLRLMFNIQTKTLLKQPVNVWLQAKLPTASLSNRS